MCSVCAGGWPQRMPIQCRDNLNSVAPAPRTSRLSDATHTGTTLCASTSWNGTPAGSLPHTCLKVTHATAHHTSRAPVSLLVHSHMKHVYGACTAAHAHPAQARHPVNHRHSRGRPHGEPRVFMEAIWHDCRSRSNQQEPVSCHTAASALLPMSSSSCCYCSI